MAVDDLDVVDIISTDANGNVVLTISDHLDWSAPALHLYTLQEKLNRYLAFVESGEILEGYPGSEGRPVIFRVVSLFEPIEIAMQFLDRAKLIIENAGFAFEQTTKPNLV